MCTGITVTKRYVPRSRQTNKTGSKIDTHTVVTMLHRQCFKEGRGISKKTVFLKMEWRNTTLVLGDFLWCQRSVQYLLACYEEKKLTDTLSAPATLN